jgi:hypothetical protein
MRRFSGAFALLFVASLLLASYGHCRPMLVAQLALAASHAHHHGGPQSQHHHPTEGFGQELSIPGVQAIPPAIDYQPVAKSLMPILVVVATIDLMPTDAKAPPHIRARAGPPAFHEFHARTGRLLI